MRTTNNGLTHAKDAKLCTEGLGMRLQCAIMTEYLSLYSELSVPNSEASSASICDKCGTA